MNLYEVIVATDDNTECHWTLAESTEQLALLLADTLEFEQGYSITIKEADITSLERFCNSGATGVIESGHEFAALVNQVITACMPSICCNFPLHIFHKFYCLPKKQVLYDPRSYSNN